MKYFEINPTVTGRVILKLPDGNSLEGYIRSDGDSVYICNDCGKGDGYNWTFFVYCGIEVKERATFTKSVLGYEPGYGDFPTVRSIKDLLKICEALEKNYDSIHHISSISKKIKKKISLKYKI